MSDPLQGDEKWNANRVAELIEWFEELDNLYKGYLALYMDAKGNAKSKLTFSKWLCARLQKAEKRVEELVKKLDTALEERDYLADKIRDIHEKSKPTLVDTIDRFEEDEVVFMLARRGEENE